MPQAARISAAGGEIVETVSTNLAGFIDAVEAGARDGAELDPETSAATATIGGAPLSTSVRTFVFDKEGDFLADLQTVGTVCTEQDGPLTTTVETTLADLEIIIASGPAGQVQATTDQSPTPCGCPAAATETTTAQSESRVAATLLRAQLVPFTLDVELRNRPDPRGGFEPFEFKVTVSDGGRPARVGMPEPGSRASR